MRRFFTPPHKVDISPETPLAFLAGPVQGAHDWHTPLANTLLEQVPHIAVASPRRLPIDQARFNPDEQVRWELHTRERARQLGVTAFWWAAQNLEDETYPLGRAYAQTSRIELGEAIGWLRYDPSVQLVVGFDPEYKKNGGGSEDYIRRALAHHGLKVHSSLEGLTEAIITALPHSKSTNV